MADPVWTDGVTPLNAVNMTKLQTRDERNAPNGYVGLDAGSKIPVANLPDLSATYQPLSGKNAASGYVGLDASSNATLPGNLAVNGAQMVAANLYLGSAYDTVLYRSAAATLKTDGRFDVGGNLYTLGTATTYGLHYFGAADTYLYRSAAGVLNTDGQVYAAGQIASAGEVLARSGTAPQTYIGSVFGNSGVLFGQAGDTNLFRSSAGVLRTNGILNAVGGLQINGVSIGTGGVEIAYVERTSSIAAPNTLLDTGSVAYDGSAVVIEINFPYVGNAAAAGQVSIWLYDGATQLGRIALLSMQSAGVNTPVFVRRKLTPSAGSHNYKVTATQDSGSTITFYGSTGGAGADLAAYMRVTKA